MAVSSALFISWARTASGVTELLAQNLASVYSTPQDLNGVSS